MKFSTGLLCLAVALASVSSRPLKRDVDPNLVPQFGVQAGVNPDGTGNCDGIDGSNGQPILIPCSCPPDRDTFIADLNANVNAGFATNNPTVKVTFPTDDSDQSASTRIEAAIITLQNLNGPGVGCPASSTTFVAQQQAAAAGQAPPPPVSQAAPPSSSSVAAETSSAASAPAVSSAAASVECTSAAPPPVTVTVTVTVVSTSTPAAPPAVTTSAAAPPAVTTSAAAPPVVTTSAAPPAVTSATPTSSSPSSTVSLVPASLVPEFGVTAGVNPDGTGNCDGIDGSNGQPILIPCACPPDRDAFIQELSQNVAAGEVINNPTVKLTFPLDNSKASQLARLNAASDTLQNLNGPGQGCPIVSTTFQAQNAAINAEPGN